MVSVVIFAGGTGVRMKSADIPKQFLELDGKPIIIRVLQKFAAHPQVDRIVVACLESWIDHLQGLIKQFGVSKIDAIVPGGATGFDSIHNGLVRATRDMAPNDVVLISDGVRPVLTEALISTCIETARQYETAVPVVPSIDSVLQSADGAHCRTALPRGQMFITQAPQGYTVRKILWAHDEAIRRKLPSPVSSSELLIDLGEEIHLFMGDQDNIKVTTDYDLHVLRSRYEYQKHHGNNDMEATHGL